MVEKFRVSGLIKILAAAGVLGGASWLVCRQLDENYKRDLDTEVTSNESSKPFANPELYKKNDPIAAVPFKKECSPSKSKLVYDSRVPTLERVLTEYVPRSWVADEGSFYRTAVEQLIGSSNAFGIIKLFEDLPRDASKVTDGKRVWATDKGLYQYARADGRHHLEISAKDSSLRLAYQLMTDGHNNLDGLIGQKYATDAEGKPLAFQYALHPGQIRDTGSIRLGASKYTGKQIFGQPLWEDLSPVNEFDGYFASADALWILRNKNLDKLFKDF